jgi:hypothetical protein
MSENPCSATPSTVPNCIGDVRGIVQRINEILASYSDKDWNYSRIRLTAVEVAALDSPYLLDCELLDLGTARGERECKEVQNEVVWGDHHSSELGILEIISLRVNKALLSLRDVNLAANNTATRKKIPVMRLRKRQDLLVAGTEAAIWYEITEVGGEEFDNR